MIRKISFEDAKRQYVHRFTMEHVPNWAFKGVRDGLEIKFYAPQYATDLEWYERTAFPGEPDHDGSRHHCYSRRQTWPMGQWLARPYRQPELAAA